MKILLLLLLMLPFAGCVNEPFNKSTKTIALDGFTVETSSDWNAFITQGYDSRTGMISNGKNELKYDLGWYSYNFKNETNVTHYRTDTTINGRDALIVRPKKKGKGIIGIYIKADSLVRFNLYGTTKDEEEILRIFNSVKIL